MKTTFECRCGNTEMTFDTSVDRLGWYCRKCQTFWGLTDNEEKLYQIAFDEGKDFYSHIVESYYKLKEVLRNVVF
jgi:hypothetical protein